MSNETKFTKGEWHVESNDDSHSVNCGQYNVAVFSGWNFGERPIEEKANAHLASAAPDMYDALELLMNDLDVYRKDLGFSENTKSQNQARKALKKARGEQ